MAFPTSVVSEGVRDKNQFLGFSLLNAFRSKSGGGSVSLGDIQEESTVLHLQSYVRLSNPAVSDLSFNYVCPGFYAERLEMVINPGIVSIFKAVDDRSASYGYGILIRERVR